MSSPAAPAPAKKTTARKTAPVKTTPPRGAKKTAAKRPASGPGSKGGQLNASETRHGKVVTPVWERAQARAGYEGRGIWEVIRQQLAEYGNEPGPWSDGK